MRNEFRAEQGAIERSDTHADLSYLRDEKFDTNTLLGPEPQEKEKQRHPIERLPEQGKAWTEADSHSLREAVDKRDWRTIGELAEKVNFHEETKGCHVYWTGDQGRPKGAEDTNKRDAERFATRLEAEGLGRYYTLEMTQAGRAFDQAFKEGRLWQENRENSLAVFNVLSHRFSEQGDAKTVYICAYGGARERPPEHGGGLTLLYTTEAENIKRNIDEGKVSLVGVAQYSNENARFEDPKFYKRLG